MTIIQLSDVPAASESETMADVAAVIAQNGPPRFDREIAPESARAIAYWWQSPGSVGHVLASFASGYPVDHEELLTDIHRSRLEASSGPDKQALDCLATFVSEMARQAEQ